MPRPRRVGTDPRESGGLFIGRRPTTRPLRLRRPPPQPPPWRKRFDRLFASSLLLFEVVVCALLWGPIPVAALWVGSQIDYLSGSLMAGLIAAVAAVAAALYGALALLLRVDRLWVLVRRATGHPQQEGVLARVFAVGAVLGGSAFAIWFLLIHGPGSTLFSGNGGT
jgi:hypothetical protein